MECSANTQSITTSGWFWYQRWLTYHLLFLLKPTGADLPFPADVQVIERTWLTTSGWFWYQRWLTYHLLFLLKPTGADLPFPADVQVIERTWLTTSGWFWSQRWLTYHFLFILELFGGGGRVDWQQKMENWFTFPISWCQLNNAM